MYNKPTGLELLIFGAPQIKYDATYWEQYEPKNIDFDSPLGREFRTGNNHLKTHIHFLDLALQNQEITNKLLNESTIKDDILIYENQKNGQNLSEIIRTIDTSNDKIAKTITHSTQKLAENFNLAINDIRKDLDYLTYNISLGLEAINNTQFEILSNLENIKDALRSNLTNNARQLVDQGVRNFRNNYLDDAEERFRTALKSDNTYFEALLYLGEINYRKGKYDTAIDLTIRSQCLPSNINAQLIYFSNHQLLRIYLKKGDLKSAYRTVMEILKYRKDANNYFIAAKLALKNSIVDESVYHCVEACSLDLDYLKQLSLDKDFELINGRHEEIFYKVFSRCKHEPAKLRKITEIALITKHYLVAYDVCDFILSESTNKNYCLGKYSIFNYYCDSNDELKGKDYYIAAWLALLIGEFDQCFTHIEKSIDCDSNNFRIILGDVSFIDIKEDICIILDHRLDLEKKKIERCKSDVNVVINGLLEQIQNLKDYPFVNIGSTYAIQAIYQVITTFTVIENQIYIPSNYEEVAQVLKKCAIYDSLYDSYFQEMSREIVSHIEYLRQMDNLLSQKAKRLIEIDMELRDTIEKRKMHATFNILGWCLYSVFTFFSIWSLFYYEIPVSSEIASKRLILNLISLGLSFFNYFYQVTLVDKFNRKEIALNGEMGSIKNNMLLTKKDIEKKSSVFLTQNLKQFRL